MFGTLMPELALVLVAPGGMIAGGLVGLVAGGFAPNRVGLTVTLLGLGLLQLLGSMAFVLPLYSDNEAMRIGQLALLWPSIPANCVLAACCWIVPSIWRAKA